MKIWSWALVACSPWRVLNAEAARRLGGGGSVGRQSGNVTQREAAKPNQAAPAQARTRPRPPRSPAANPAAAAPKRPWGAMLGGLAAGLGLAWLANSLGLGAAFGQFLMFALLAMVVMVVIGFIMRSRRNAQPNRPLAFQGAGCAGRPGDAAAPVQPGQGGQRRLGPAVGTQHHGVRRRQAGRRGPACRSDRAWPDRRLGACPRASTPKASWRAAKRNFVTLQDAWDRGDVASLRSMMTDEMLGEIKSQLTEREKRRAACRTRPRW